MAQWLICHIDLRTWVQILRAHVESGHIALLQKLEVGGGRNSLQKARVGQLACQVQKQNSKGFVSTKEDEA